MLPSLQPSPSTPSYPSVQLGNEEETKCQSAAGKTRKWSVQVYGIVPHQFMTHINACQKQRRKCSKSHRVSWKTSMLNSPSLKLSFPRTFQRHQNPAKRCSQLRIGVPSVPPLEGFSLMRMASTGTRRKNKQLKVSFLTSSHPIPRFGVSRGGWGGGIKEGHARCVAKWPSRYVPGSHAHWRVFQLRRGSLYKKEKRKKRKQVT